MKMFIYLTTLFNVLLSSSCSLGMSFENYENDTYRIMLRQKSDNMVDFIILNKDTQSKMVCTPALVIIDGDIPEGSLRVDHNRLDECLYQCDSTYCINTDSISIAFALEVSNHKRLDLVIYNSRLQDFIDGDYTLVQQPK